LEDEEQEVFEAIPEQANEGEVDKESLKLVGGMNDDYLNEDYY